MKLFPKSQLGTGKRDPGNRGKGRSERQVPDPFPECSATRFQPDKAARAQAGVRKPRFCAPGLHSEYFHFTANRPRKMSAVPPAWLAVRSTGNAGRERAGNVSLLVGCTLPLFGD